MSSNRTLCLSIVALILSGCAVSPTPFKLPTLSGDAALQCRAASVPASNDWDEVSEALIKTSFSLALCECKRAALAALWNGKGEVCDEKAILEIESSFYQAAPK